MAVLRSLRSLSTLLLLAVPAALAIASPATARTNHALIVAVTEYPNFSQRLWLRGPNNDARLVREFLGSLPADSEATFAPENITTLMTAPDMTNPSRQAVLDALDALAREAVEGDFVFLHFSGHGSYQKSNDANEPDGKDEVFLPYDTGMPVKVDGVTIYPSAITDNEFAEKLDAIRATGANVWAVFDFCHSGSVTRAQEEEGVMDRRLDMVTDFDVDPSEAAVEVEDDSVERSREVAIGINEIAPAAPAAGRGSLVAFFAAQSIEPTKEKFFPDADGNPVSYGIFSRALYAAVASNPGITYRQLAETVVQTYLSQNRTAPTPMFEGNLDFAVFGTEELDPRKQWIMSVAESGEITIPAGELHGLAVGAQLLILPTAASANEDAVGVAEVTSAEMLRSTLKIVADADGNTLAADAMPASAFARLDGVPYRFALRVARPDDRPEADPQLLAEVNAALDAIEADPKSGVELEIVPAGAPADLRLSVMSDADVANLEDPSGLTAQSLDASPQLWFLQDTGEVTLVPNRRPASMNFGDDNRLTFEQRLSHNLQTIYRATGLSRLAVAGTNTFKPDDLALTYHFQRRGETVLEPMRLESPTDNLMPGDLVHLDFTNQSESAVDINILYIEADYQIQHACRARLAPGEYIFQPLIGLSTEDVGLERLIAVVTEVARDGITTQEDLSYLTQAGLERGTEANRDIAPGLAGMLQQLGTAELGRGELFATAEETEELPLGAVIAFPMEVLPLADGETAPASNELRAASTSAQLPKELKRGCFDNA